MSKYILVCLLALFGWMFSMLYSQTRDWEEMYSMIEHRVVDMKYTTINGIYEDGLLFALAGNGGGLAYFTTPGTLEIFNFSTNLGAVSIIPDEQNNRIFCAFGRGSYSDGLYEFDVNTQQFELINWFAFPNFVKKLTSGFYLGFGIDNYGGLYHSFDGDQWLPVFDFIGRNVIDIEETGDGTIFIAAGNDLFISNNGDYYVFELDLVINDIFVRPYPNYNEVYIACGDGTDSDAVYRVEYEDGEITGFTFINYFYQPQKIFHYWNNIVVGCNGEYGNLFLVEPVENGQVMEIGAELGINEVYCFEFYPIYTHNFLVGTDVGIFLGTNFDFTSLDDMSAIASINYIRNYPNPFNPQTKIEFNTEFYCAAKLLIYNIKGEKIFTLFDDFLQPGKHSFIWDGTDHQGRQVSSGVYFSQLITENGIETSKMLLLK
ncbi:MAG: T9SS type A sorting domain-containing protein [Candidatus Cloacimonetes bacterium]|nr:T9SS type A sorting domain-containing protein [Candidatus Cloacimonadota bacterium]